MFEISDCWISEADIACLFLYNLHLLVAAIIFVKAAFSARIGNLGKELVKNLVISTINDLWASVFADLRALLSER